MANLFSIRNLCFFFYREVGRQARCLIIWDELMILLHAIPFGKEMLLFQLVNLSFNNCISSLTLESKIFA